MMGTHTNLTTKVLNSEAELIVRGLSDPQGILLDAIEDLDLGAFLNSLECHRLTVPFYLAIKDNQFLTEPLKELLLKSFTTKRLRILNHVAELCKVIVKFRQLKIDAVALKGPVLGQQYYCDYTTRECNDLDILVKPHSVQAAYHTLQEMGYELTEVLWSSQKQKSLYHKTFHHYNLYNPSNDITIELHWRLYSSKGVDTDATESIWGDLSTQRIGRIEFQTLSKVDNFIYLCVHGSSHQWKRLFWVQDIAHIIQMEGEGFIKNAFQTALQRKVDRYVLEGCNLSSILFKVCLPKMIVDSIGEDKRVGKLSTISLFTINNVTNPDQSPMTSWNNFILAIKKLVNHYKTKYYLGGYKVLFTTFKRFFINPKYWNIYSFSDKWFFLNYMAAPFLWAYSVVNKNKE